MELKGFLNRWFERHPDIAAEEEAKQEDVIDFFRREYSRKALEELDRQILEGEEE